MQRAVTHLCGDHVLVKDKPRVRVVGITVDGELVRGTKVEGRLVNHRLPAQDCEDKLPLWAEGVMARILKRPVGVEVLDHVVKAESPVFARIVSHSRFVIDFVSSSTPSPRQP